jgi:hypothetical protein
MLSICDDIEEKYVIPVDDSVALLRNIYDLQKEIDNDEKGVNR